MKPIHIKIIPHSEQRYNTEGDYWETDDSIEVRISDIYDAVPCLIHELVEMFLCMRRGIKFEDIDKFDMAYKGDNPGAEGDSPYHKEHAFAGIIEELFSYEYERSTS